MILPLAASSVFSTFQSPVRSMSAFFRGGEGLRHARSQAYPHWLRTQAERHIDHNRSDLIQSITCDRLHVNSNSKFVDYMRIQNSKFKLSDPVVRSSSKFMYRAFRTWRIDCEYSQLPTITPSYCSSIRILTHVHVSSISLFPLSYQLQNSYTGHFAYSESIASTHERV